MLSEVWVVSKEMNYGEWCSTVQTVVVVCIEKNTTESELCMAKTEVGKHHFNGMRC